MNNWVTRNKASLPHLRVCSLFFKRLSSRHFPPDETPSAIEPRIQFFQRTMGERDQASILDEQAIHLSIFLWLGYKRREARSIHAKKEELDVFRMFSEFSPEKTKTRRTWSALFGRELAVLSERMRMSSLRKGVLDSISGLVCLQRAIWNFVLGGHFQVCCDVQDRYNYAS